ncbi:MAG: FixH family protein [Beijerinckiaceae bacterium]
MPTTGTGAAAAGKPITGRFVLFALIAFFGVVFAVNATMMAIALTTMPGLDVRNGYVASQAMNGAYAAMRAQTDRGWSVDAALRRAGDGAVLKVEIRDRDGAPVAGLDVTATLAHPALVKADRSAPLPEAAPGIYAGTIDSVKAGSWTLGIAALQGGQPIFSSRNRVSMAE